MRTYRIEMNIRQLTQRTTFPSMAILVIFLSGMTTAQPREEFNEIGKAIAGSGGDQFTSKCCSVKTSECTSYGRTCEDYIKPPYLITTCRCIITIADEYRRFQQDCFQKAVALGEERAALELSREIIRKLPHEGGSDFPGKAAESGAKGPADRGKIAFPENM